MIKKSDEGHDNITAQPYLSFCPDNQIPYPSGCVLSPGIWASHRLLLCWCTGGGGGGGGGGVVIDHLLCDLSLRLTAHHMPLYGPHNSQPILMGN